MNTPLTTAPLTVVVVARGYPRPGHPTHGIFEWDQAKALAGQGHRVLYASLDIRSLRRRRPFGIHHETLDGVDVYDLNWPIGQPAIPLTDAALKAAWSLAWRDVVAHAGPPDIVHAHFTPWAHAVATSRLRSRYALAVTEHWSKVNVDDPPPGLLRLAREAYRGADAVIAVSPDQAKRMAERFGITPVVVPNVVETGIFAAARRPAVRGRRIVTVGHLRPGKRVDLLIESLATMPEASLTIIGDGSEHASLHALVTERGLGERVQFTGALPREDIAARFADADVFALASERETFGVAAVEALAAGLPVVSTACGGPESFLTSDNGIVVEDAGDLPAALAQALDRDWDVASIRSTVEQFAPDAVASRLVDVYRTVVRQGGTGQRR